MDEDRAFAEGLAALAQHLVGGEEMQFTLDRVARLTVDAVRAVDAIGLTLRVDGGQRTRVFTDVVAPRVDQVQYEADDGPCIETLRTGKVHEIDSTLRHPRWRPFCDACAAEGILSTYSVPLIVAGETHGAMNMYSRTEDAFDDQQRRAAGLFAAQASVVLANEAMYWAAQDRSDQFRAALDSRDLIGMAKGIIMATMRCDADAAFAVLSQQSQHQNRKLHDVAADVVRSIHPNVTL